MIFILCYFSWNVVSSTDDDGDDVCTLHTAYSLSATPLMFDVYFALLMWVHCLLYIMTLLDSSAVTVVLYDCML